MITIDFNRLSIRPGDRILDIGCGTGRHTCAAFRFKNAVAIGVDINVDDVSKAKCRLIEQKGLKDYDGGIWGMTVADVLKLPFKDDCFDLVICSEVMEHINDHRNAVSEAVRVLKPNKNLVVSVPRYFPERICWTLSCRSFRKRRGKNMESPFRPQSPHALLVAQMPRRPLQRRQSPGQQVPRSVGMGHDAAPAHYLLSGSPLKSRHGKEHSRLFQKRVTTLNA